MLQIPYHSQEDSDARKYRNDCGPTCASMILEWAGKGHIAVDSLAAETTLAQHDDGLLVYPVAKLLTDHGVPAQMKANVTLDMIKQEVQTNQRPMIALVQYGVISERINKADVWGHFVVVVGIDDSNVYLNDPDWYGPQRDHGAGLAVKIGEFTKGMADSSPANYGVFLTATPSTVTTSPAPTTQQPSQPTTTSTTPVASQPTPTTQPTQSTQTTQPSQTTPTSGAFYVNTPAGVRLRDTPGGANIVEKIPNNTNITVLSDAPVDAQIDGTNYTWVKIKSAAGNTGWCVRDYLAAGTAPSSS